LRGKTIAEMRGEGSRDLKRLKFMITSKAKNPQRKIRNSFFPHISIGQMPMSFVADNEATP
jgi:hypothetical protein